MYLGYLSSIPHLYLNDKGESSSDMWVNADKELSLCTPKCHYQLLGYVPSLKVTAQYRVREVFLDKVTCSGSIMAVQYHVELELILIGTCVVSGGGERSVIK